MVLFETQHHKGEVFHLTELKPSQWNLARHHTIQRLDCEASPRVLHSIKAIKRTAAYSEPVMDRCEDNDPTD